MINCGVVLAADEEAVTGSGAALEASSSTGAGSVKGAALARMSCGSAESCDPCQTTELELLTRGSASAGEGLAKLARPQCRPRSTRSTWQRTRRRACSLGVDDGGSRERAPAYALAGQASVRAASPPQRPQSR